MSKKVFLIPLVVLFIWFISSIIPEINFDEGFIQIILSVSTFLFGIFIGFSISDRYRRIEKIRENDSSERSALISVYHLSESFGKATKKKIQELIDKYLMAILDYRIWDFAKTEKNFEDISTKVSSLKPKNSRERGVYQEMIGLIDQGRNLRGETSEIINERLSTSEWIIHIFLGLLILISIVLLGDETLLSLILSSLLSASVLFLIVLLHSFDNLSWKSESRIFEPYALAFESIGMTRYYPEEIIEKGMVRNYKNQDYRVGIFPNPYPNMAGKKVKLVKVNQR